MGGGTGMAGLNAVRFAGWPRLLAGLALALLAGFLVLSVWTPVTHVGGAARPAGELAEATKSRPRDFDLALYDRVIERLRGGEHYYDFIAAEQRKAEFPLRPAVAVRLPTLAYVNAWLGDGGLVAASFILLFAVLFAWWRRLGEEEASGLVRLFAMAGLVFGASLGTTRYFFTLHELWSGMLLALAFALHRPGKWAAAIVPAALALAIREHALPFILLMAAMAGWRRDWREAGAWGGLAAVFLLALAWHVRTINAMLLPSDGVSAPWLVLRGLTGFTSDMVLSSNLRFMPGWMAAPLVILALFGWTGWKTAAGEFGALLYSGYGLLFMIAGRADNYYWGFMVTPAFFMGLAFAPRALKSLLTTIARR